MLLLQNLAIGKYYQTNSSIHHLDPRAKLLSFISLTISISVVDNMWGVLIVSSLMAIVIFLSRLPIRLLLRYVRPMLWLFLSIILLSVFFTDANTESLFSIGPIKAMWKGLYNGLIMSYRFLLIFLGGAVLTLSTMPLHLSGGISEILRPLKKIGVPVDQIPIMMMVTLHFIPSLFMEGEKLIMAQKSRGFHLESYKILKNLRLAPALLIPLLRNAFRMADDLAMSLESRCYSGGDRTYLNELKFTKTDFIIIFFAIAMIPLIIVISL